MGESKLTTNKPALIQPTTFRSAGAAAQAVDTPHEPAQCPVIPMQGPPGSDEANKVVQGDDRLVYHYYSCKGNLTLEEANATCADMFGLEEVPTEYYWKATYDN
jgi:hypothetical protein